MSTDLKLPPIQQNKAVPPVSPSKQKISKWKLKRMEPIERSRYLAYHPTEEVTEKVNKCTRRIHKWNRSRRKENRLPKIAENESNSLIAANAQLNAKSRIHEAVNSTIKHRTSELETLIYAQPTAAEAIRLQALFLPTGFRPLKLHDTTPRRQRQRIETLMEDFSGLEVGRIICCD